MQKHKSKIKMATDSAKQVTVVLVLVLSAASVSFGKYGGGTGEPNEPYKIATPNDLNDIGNHPEDFSKHFILVNDINLAGLTYSTAVIAPDTNNSYTNFQGTPFTGVFDGNDCNIIKLKIDTTGADNDYLGLFGQIDGPGQVRNLSIEDVNIIGGNYSDYLGGFCGEVFQHDNGTIFNCSASGSVSGGDNSWAIGGMCGSNWGRISNSYANCSVSAGDSSYCIGGLCGSSAVCLINCYASGKVTGGDGSACIGGLCGSLFCSSIINCFATGPVTGGSGSGSVGGLCGESNDGTIGNCYATGSVVGDNEVGGLCGSNRGISTSNCYATGSVSGGDYVGGLCGGGGSVTSNCYATGFVSGGNYVGGLCGDCYSAANNHCYFLDPNDGGGPDNGVGTPLTNQEMEQQESFVDWDFVEVWDIGEDHTYPFLRRYAAGDLDHDGKVDFGDAGILCSRWLEERE